MAVAPDPVLPFLVLHDAVQMSAGCGESAKISFTHSNQNDRFRTESDNLKAFFQEFGIIGCSRFDLCCGSLRSIGRAQKAKNRINRRSQQTDYRRPQEPVDKTPAE